MSDLGLICDVCGRTVHGMTFVHGMKFCAKCYQETFNNNVTKDIVDILNKEIYELQNYNLKQQLTEKDEEIERLQNQKAIEELEKLKELAKDEFDLDICEECEDCVYCDLIIFEELINKRIKELKRRIK